MVAIAHLPFDQSGAIEHDRGRFSVSVLYFQEGLASLAIRRSSSWQNNFELVKESGGRKIAHGLSRRRRGGFPRI
jgi:hypothetical protein